MIVPQSRERAECTFHPHTSEGRNRQLLMHLLAHDDDDNAHSM